MRDNFSKPRFLGGESLGGIWGRSFLHSCIVYGWRSGGPSSQICWRRLSVLCLPSAPADLSRNSLSIRCWLLVCVSQFSQRDLGYYNR